MTVDPAWLTLIAIDVWFARGNVGFACLVGGAVWMSLLMLVLAERYLEEHRPIPAEMRRFVERFVEEFARPLVRQSAAEQPIKARVRYVADAKRLDILIAPGEGHTYPNLSDHKKNVEYDVQRVLALVGNGRARGGALRSHGAWVVIPVRLGDDSREAGAR